jgi:hypothetical protein
MPQMAGKKHETLQSIRQQNSGISSGNPDGSVHQCGTARGIYLRSIAGWHTRIPAGAPMTWKFVWTHKKSVDILDFSYGVVVGLTIALFIIISVVHP